MAELPEPEPWDDNLADVLAAVEAARTDDLSGLAVILRNCNSYAALVTAIKLLAEVADEIPASAEHFRQWARLAVNRST